MSYRKIHDSFEDKDRMPSALTVVSVIVCILCIGYATGSFSLMTPLISAGLFFLLGLWTFIKIYTAHRLDSRMERVYPDHQWDKELQEFQLWAIVILTIALEILLLIWPRTTSGIDAVIIIAILLGVYYNNKSGKEIAQEDQIRRARAIDPERPF